MKFVQRRRLELTALIELLRRLIFRLSDHGTASDKFGSLIGLEECVLHQTAAKSLAAFPKVHRKRCKKLDWRRISAHPVGQTRANLIPADGAASEHILPRAAVPSHCNVRSDRPIVVVQNGRGRATRLIENAWLRQKFLQIQLLLWKRVEGCAELVPLLGGKLEVGLIRQDLLGCMGRLLDHKVRHSRLLQFCRTSDHVFWSGCMFEAGPRLPSEWIHFASGLTGAAT